VATDNGRCEGPPSSDWLANPAIWTCPLGTASDAGCVAACPKGQVARGVAPTAWCYNGEYVKPGVSLFSCVSSKSTVGGTEHEQPLLGQQKHMHVPRHAYARAYAPLNSMLGRKIVCLWLHMQPHTCRLVCWHAAFSIAPPPSPYLPPCIELISKGA
jgi:hypothetical protein